MSAAPLGPPSLPTSPDLTSPCPDMSLEWAGYEAGSGLCAHTRECHIAGVYVPVSMPCLQADFCTCWQEGLNSLPLAHHHALLECPFNMAAGFPQNG